MEDNFEFNAILDSLSEILSPLNFPSDVHKWMKINAKPKMALKLMKVCKLFRHSDGFPYLVVKQVQRSITSGGYFQWILSTLDGKTIETKHLQTITEKLWIVGNIEIYGLPKDVSTLLRKTAVCNIQKLILSRQRITFDEFKRLTDDGMVEKCVMSHTNIIYENNEIVPHENIFECLPNAREIDYVREALSFFSSETAKAKLSSKLEKFTLYITPTIFDIHAVFDYMKKNQHIQYTLKFWGFSKEEFAQDIAPAVNKMLEEWSPDYKKPGFF